MTISKGKIFALFAVAMMIASAACVVCSYDNTVADGKSNATESIILDTHNSWSKADFESIGAQCDDASYTFDSATNTGTLKLKNFKFETTAARGIVLDISMKPENTKAVIELEGDNVITCSGTADDTSAIYCATSLTIIGDKDTKLTVSAGNAIKTGKDDSYSSGIDVTESLEIKGGLMVSATSGTAMHSYGISASATDHALKIENSTVVAVGADASLESLGISGFAVELIGEDCIVNATAGNASEPTGAQNGSFGIYGVTIEIDGATVVAQSGNIPFNLTVAMVASVVNIQNASLTLTGGDVTTPQPGSSTAGLVVLGSNIATTSAIKSSVITAIGGEISSDNEISGGIATYNAKGGAITLNVTDCQFGDTYGQTLSLFQNTGTAINVTPIKDLEGSNDGINFTKITTSEQLVTYKYVRSIIPDLDIDVTSPANGSTVDKETVTVRGTSTGYEVAITVNGTLVDIVKVKDGTFSLEITLEKGKNEISVTAINIRGETLTENIEVTYGSSQSDINPALLIVVIIAILAVAGIAVASRKN